MSLLIAFIVKSSHILAGIHFIFLKDGPRPNLNERLSFPNLDISENIEKVVIK